MSQVSRVRCCVLGCSATYQSTDQSGEKVRFFGFPSRPHDVERRNKWIDNIRLARKDVDGVWSPSKNSKVCSRHFVGNVKGEDPREANYNPTVFPSVSKKTARKFNRIYIAKAEQKGQTKSGHTPKSTEGSGTRSLLLRAGKTKEHSSPSFNAATAEAPGGTTMEGQRAVHLASVVDGDANLDSGVLVTLDDFLREWSVDPHPKYVTPKCEEGGPNDDAAASAGCKEPSTGQGAKGRAFQCPICGDRYISSRSLRRHLSRRSFLARLPCRKCGSCHLAFNRCTLIMRAQGCQIGANVATVSALPPGETLVPVELLEEGDASPQQTDVPMTVLEKVLQSVVCSECYTNLDDDGFREDHFQPSRGNLIRCSSCPMLCTSECALRAHRRLHAQRRPYVCPECGLRCEDEWSVFHQHVSRHCHHFERIVGYHCQLCPALLLDKAELAGHMVDTHSNALHKCQACPMAFVTLESFQMHRQATHPKLRPQCWLILKCPLCEAVFASSDLLATHAVSCHLDQCGRSLFKCTTCDSLQPTRADLVAHVRKLHPDMHQVYPWGREDKGSLVPFAAAGRKRPAKGEVINLDDDDVPEAEAKKTGDEAGPSSSKATQPKRKGPGSPAPSLAVPKSAAEKDTPGTIKNAEGGQAASNSAKTAPAEQPPEKQSSSAKVCAKCGFESSDSSAFRDHIKTHKPANQETFQCPECGLCYVVEPSLRKHLRGVHRVEKTEVKKGISAAGGNAGAARDDGLRCSVCLATFDTERELKSHTRSHGMAFLKKVKAKDGTV